MAILQFPPVEQADEHGLLAVGGDLEVDSLLLAYRSGIFPWPISEAYPITWFSPPKRAMLFLKDFHVSRSLKKLLSKGQYTFRINHAFEEVIRACAEGKYRKRQQGTWITEEMIEAYIELHRAGSCHSVGCYDNTTLVGGLYGVSIGKMFAGESMFFRQPNASKLAVCYLIDYLKQKDVQWIDCQEMTPLLESFGAVEIRRSAFLELLGEAVDEDIQLFPVKRPPKSGCC